MLMMLSPNSSHQMCTTAWACSAVQHALSGDAQLLK